MWEFNQKLQFPMVDSLLHTFRSLQPNSFNLLEKRGGFYLFRGEIF